MNERNYIADEKTGQHYDLADSAEGVSDNPPLEFPSFPSRRKGDEIKDA